MITADYHIHSSFSSDGKVPMEQMIEAAIEKGLHYLCFTDHMDYHFPKEYDMTFQFDPDSYWAELDRVIPKYASDITVCRGIELGIQDGVEDPIRRLLDTYPFDFVIASTHLIDGIDPYYPEFWEGRPVDESIRRCFDRILHNMDVFPDFDTLGHLDYVMRYCPTGLDTYSYEKFAPELNAVIDELASRGKCLEINTNSFRYGFSGPHPIPEVIRRYFDQDGIGITIGSDAHTIEHLAQQFDRTETILKNLGVSSYNIFQGRKRIELKF